MNLPIAQPLNCSLRLPGQSKWAELDSDRSGFHRAFVRIMGESPQIHGRVLDVGCGPGLPSFMSELAQKFQTLDGVDPSPDIERHPVLDQRWNAPLESSNVPSGWYDLAYAYYVLEHVAEPRPFLAKVYEVLKPGGVFWALTPNWNHPFAILSRTIEKIGLKDYARRRVGLNQATGTMAVNDYPAYYRCNTPASILRAVGGLGFRRATFFHYPSLQWDRYFPRRLRWAPNLYDACLGIRFSCLMQILIVRLEK